MSVTSGPRGASRYETRDHQIAGVREKNLTSCEENPRTVSRQAHSSLPNTSFTTLLREDVTYLRHGADASLHRIDRCYTDTRCCTDSYEHSCIVKEITMTAKGSNDSTIYHRQ